MGYTFDLHMEDGGFMRQSVPASRTTVYEENRVDGQIEFYVDRAESSRWYAITRNDSEPFYKVHIPEGKPPGDACTVE